MSGFARLRCRIGSLELVVEGADTFEITLGVRDSQVHEALPFSVA